MKLKEGDHVKVSRQKARDGKIIQDTGVIQRISDIVIIEGEKSGRVLYDSDQDMNYHKLSSLELIE